MTKFIYSFGRKSADGSAGMTALLGTKGASLAEMSRLGLPVPPGFVIASAICAEARAGGLPPVVMDEAMHALSRVEQAIGRRFGDPDRPLLVIVHAAAGRAMPGLLETIEGIGLNEATTAGLARQTGDTRFAFDSFRRFIERYATLVLGVDPTRFAAAALPLGEPAALDSKGLRQLIAAYRAVVVEATGADFPERPRDQFEGVLATAFASWNAAEAVAYRRQYSIPDAPGLAVTVQAMVFGNLLTDSAAGIAYTRDPRTGSDVVAGGYLLRARGDELRAGRPGFPIGEGQRDPNGAPDPSLERTMPLLFDELVEACGRVEHHYRDLQEIDFTIERGRLWLLDIRPARRSALAAVRTAVEMAREGLISEAQAIDRVESAQLDQLLHTAISASAMPAAWGQPASPGAACGAVAFEAEEAVRLARAGVPCILVRADTGPADAAGIHAAVGTLVTQGGPVCHAAITARAMSRPCVMNASAVLIEADGITIDGRRVARGQAITIDGATGAIHVGAAPIAPAMLTDHCFTLLRWADKTRQLKVRASVDTAVDAANALDWGAEGIGLFRTELMFLAPSRLPAVRAMMLAPDRAQWAAALAPLLEPMREEFSSLFHVTGGREAVIRLLDAPLRHFLPRDETELAATASQLGLDVAELRETLAVSEGYPLLDRHGRRLATACPELYELQLRALFEAWVDVAAQSPGLAPVEVMIAATSGARELDDVRTLVERVAATVAFERGRLPRYGFGAMIGMPAAVLHARELAGPAALFGFDGDDLARSGLEAEDIGEAVNAAMRDGRAARGLLPCGLSGEPGGDPAAIAAVAGTALDYVSCPPLRVPVARLAAAQAELALVRTARFRSIRTAGLKVAAE